jgi:hypothetical protein
MTPDDGNAVDNPKTKGLRTTPTCPMKATIISDDSTEDLDEELEERYGPKRCRTCG